MHSLSKVFLLIGITALPTVSEAALVNIASNSFAAGGRMVVTSSGAPLAFGSVVRIGSFPTGVPAGATTFAAVDSAFVPIGEDPGSAADGTNGPLTINDVNPTGTTRGHYAGTISNVDNADPRFAAATRLYVFVLNAPPASQQTATEWAIFSDPAWTIPSTATRTMTTSAIDQPAEVFYGSLSGAEIRMAPVPEPSAAVLGLAGLGLLVRRRR